VKISCDFVVLGNVVRNKGKLTVVHSADDGRLVVICLTLITLKPRLISPSYISSAGVLCGRWRITALTVKCKVRHSVVVEV
jgi:hypothetical protein